MVLFGFGPIGASLVSVRLRHFSKRPVRTALFWTSGTCRGYRP
jgi:hypothetical protein